MEGKIMNDFGGIDPPSERLNANYKQQTVNPRKCTKCGKMHDMIVEDTKTGERLNEIEKCKDCLMGSSSFNFHTHQLQLKAEDIEKLETEMMQQELSRLQKEIIDGHSL